MQGIELKLRKCNEERMDLIDQQSTVKATQAVREVVVWRDFEPIHMQQHAKYREERDACLREVATKCKISGLAAICGDQTTPLCESTADEFIRAVEEHSHKLQQERHTKLIRS